MQQLIPLLSSLLLTAIFSFTLPLLIVGGLLTALVVLSTATALAPLSQEWMAQVLDFLRTLGNGNPWHGAITLGGTASTVGVLFDTYNFYRFQSFGHR